MNDAQKIYLRVLNDLPFMFQIFGDAEQQADTFTLEMLRQRILHERNAYNVEKDREQREYEARRIQENANQVETLERRTDD